MRHHWVFLLFFFPHPVFAQEPPGSPPSSVLPEALIKQTLCAAEPCQIFTAWGAGRDAAGRDMSVVGVQFGPVPPPISPTTAMAPDDVMAPDGVCVPAPHWLLRSRGGVVKSKEEIITLFKESECNYGVAGGEEGLTLDGQVLTFASNGGSSWAWYNSKSWRLTPKLVKIREAESSFWKMGMTNYHIERDLENEVVHVEWFTPYAGEIGGCSEEEASGCFFYDEIPLWSLGPDQKDFDWRTASRLLRFLRVDSSGKGGLRTGGFVIHGKAGKSEDAVIQVMALNAGEIVVEIADDISQTQNPSWIKNDHLEIWADQNKDAFHRKEVYRAGSPDAPTNDDYGVVVKKPVQWGIDLAGKVFAGFGSPQDSPKIVVKGKRFKITLPFVPTHLTVVYSDSDDGKTQERLIATSKLIFGEALSLGKIEESAKAKDSSQPSTP
jgi:hypothetical protein